MFFTLTLANVTRLPLNAAAIIALNQTQKVAHAHLRSSGLPLG